MYAPLPATSKHQPSDRPAPTNALISGVFDISVKSGNLELSMHNAPIQTQVWCSLTLLGENHE
jgi:hypothetical protein